MTWREFVEKQNSDLYEPQEPDTRYYPYYNDPHYSHIHREKHHEPPPSSSSLEFPSSSPCSNDSSTYGPSGPTPEVHKYEMEKAFDLIDCILHPESVRRMTPRQVLAHPFLRSHPSSDGMEEEEEPDDDEYVPHSYESGNGVCRQWHFKDDVTEVESVKMMVRCQCGFCHEGRSRGPEREGVDEYYEEFRELVAGEGIAIGKSPCEFHRDLVPGVGEVD